MYAEWFYDGWIYDGDAIDPSKKKPCTFYMDLSFRKAVMPSPPLRMDRRSNTLAFSLRFP
jgi:hypothetical protein